MQLNPEQAKRVAGALLRDQSWVSGRPGMEGSEWRAGQFPPGAFGRYQLLRLVGVGGMGEVYEAEQESPRRQVALKVVRPELLSTEAAARFEHEARILGRLQHPGIAQIYEAGRIESNGCLIPYFAMEFVAGRPLVEYADEQRLSTKARLELFLSVCDAVEHAHRKGVIHRDLKPGNILVDSSGHPRVLDFGVARLADTDGDGSTLRTDMGRLMGTLAYMSPEQVSADREGLDTRSDVYALGVLLYQLLSGKLPYELTATHLPEAARIIREREPAPMSTTNRTLRGDIETIVKKALAKERNRRYQSVGDLAADIRRYLRDAPIEAKPPSAIYQLRKFATRNRGVVMATSLAVLAMLAGGIATGWLAWKQSGLIAELTKTRAAESEQRRAADGKRKEAERFSAAAWEVIDFVSDSIKAASPLNSDDDFTMLQFVEQASETLERSPIKDPLTEGAVRAMLGGIFSELGRPKEMLTHYQRAYDLRLADLGEWHRDTIEAAHGLAVAYSYNDNFRRALEILDHIQPHAVATLGVDAKPVLEMETSRARIMLRLGNRDDAIPVAQSAYERARRTLGDDDDITTSLADTVGEALHAAGRPSDARTYFTIVRDNSAKRYGEDSMRTIVAKGRLVRLGMFQMHRGEIETQFRELVAQVERKLGPTSIYGDSLKRDFANVLTQGQEWEEAEKIIREVIASETARRGPRNKQTLHARRLLLTILAGSGRPEEAAKLAAEVLADTEITNGPNDLDTFDAMTEYAMICNQIKEYDKAEATAREALSRSLQRYGPLSSISVSIGQRCGVVLFQQDRFADARDIFVQIVEDAKNIPNYEPDTLLYMRLSCARAHMKLKEFEEAERMLFDEPGQLPPLNIEKSEIHARYMHGVAALYEEWGKPEIAAPYRAQVNDIQAKKGAWKDRTANPAKSKSESSEDTSKPATDAEPTTDPDGDAESPDKKSDEPR